MAHADDSRQRILDTAREHFLAGSFRGATLREIARAARVTTGSLYHHFSGKDELFVEVCAQGMRNLLRRLDTAQQLTEGRPVDERAMALFDAYVAFYLEEPGYFQLITRLQTSAEQLNIGPELAERVEALSQQIVDEMVEMVHCAEPTLAPEDVRRRVLLAVAMAEGLVSCDRRGLLGRFELSLGSFRGIMLKISRELLRGL